MVIRIERLNTCNVPDTGLTLGTNKLILDHFLFILICFIQLSPCLLPGSRGLYFHLQGSLAPISWFHKQNAQELCSLSRHSSSHSTAYPRKTPKALVQHKTWDVIRRFRWHRRHTGLSLPKVASPGSFPTSSLRGTMPFSESWLIHLSHCLCLIVLFIHVFFMDLFIHVFILHHVS